MSKISQKRKREILNAAYEEFVSKGIDGTSMADIANRAGIGKSTIYEYFPSKGILLSEASMQFFGDMERAVVEKLRQEGTVEQKIYAYCEITREYMVAAEALGGMVRKSVAIMGDDMRIIGEQLIKDYTQRMEAEFCDILRQGQERGEIRQELDMEIAPMVLRSLPSMQLVRGIDSRGIENGMERAIAMVLTGLKKS